MFSIKDIIFGWNFARDWMKAEYFEEPSIRRFIQHNQQNWNEWNFNETDAEILVDFVSIHENLISVSYFVNILAREKKAIPRAFRYDSAPNHSLDKIYASFNVKSQIIPRLSTELERRCSNLYRQVRPGVKTKKELLNLNIHNIAIGIDIYETFLRDYHQPTVRIDDHRTDQIIKKALGYLLYWEDYLKDHKVKGVVVSHDSYIYNNILVKLAYKNKIPVYLPNSRGISYVEKQHGTVDYFPQFRKLFKKLPTRLQQKGVAWAKKQLALRLAGNVGVDIPYVTKSAFDTSRNNQTVLKMSNRIKVLITSHCFFDSPHGYGGMIFEDFYEWLCFLGKTSKKTNYDWYLKIHPDALPGTEEIIQEIVERYPKIKVIPQDTPHPQLVKEGIDVVLTAHGTVAHEYPALGVPVINAGHNPHVAYQFALHPKTLSEYSRMLLRLDKYLGKPETEGLYEFYFMRFDYVPADNLIFNSYRDFTRFMASNKGKEYRAYDYFLDQFKISKHNEIIANMKRFIRSGKHHFLHYESI